MCKGKVYDVVGEGAKSIRGFLLRATRFTIP